MKDINEKIIKKLKESDAAANGVTIGGIVLMIIIALL